LHLLEQNLLIYMNKQGSRIAMQLKALLIKDDLEGTEDIRNKVFAAYLSCSQVMACHWQEIPGHYSTCCSFVTFMSIIVEVV